MRLARFCPFVVVLSSGCFSGLVDLDGLEGAGDAGTAADAPLPETSIPEASNEDGPVLGWCEAQGDVVFCDDFETALAWDDVIVSPKATVEVSTDLASSPSHSLAFAVAPITEEGQGEAYRTKELPASSGPMSLSLHVWLDEVPEEQGELIPVQLILGDDSGLSQRLSVLQSIPDGTVLEVETHDGGQTDYEHYDFALNAPTKRWVRIEYRVTGVPRRLSIYLDGQPALQDLQLSALGGGELSVAVRVGGAYVSAPSDGWKVYFDNVLFD